VDRAPALGIARVHAYVIAGNDAALGLFRAVLGVVLTRHDGDAVHLVGLVGDHDWSARVAILDELRDGLHDATAARVQRSERPLEAVPAALAEFGAPAVTAREFAVELARSQARRTVAAYLGTGPLVGLLWLLTLAPPHWWCDGPAALWSGITLAPTIALGCGVGAVVLAATGRASRWMSPPSGRVVHGALTGCRHRRVRRCGHAGAGHPTRHQRRFVDDRLTGDRGQHEPARPQHPGHGPLPQGPARFLAEPANHRPEPPLTRLRT
jgi:hypothetical protein